MANRKPDENRKKKNRMIALCVLIAAAMLSGIALMVTAELPSRQPQEIEDPYAAIYSYLSGVDRQPPQTTLQATQSYTLPEQTAALPSGTAVTAVPTVPPGTIPSTTIPTTTDSPQVTLPAPNGTMHVDLAPSNKFIQIIAKQYGISTELLSAVYALPDTGQNYVLEWSGKKDANGNILRNADTLRRCFLIDTQGKVASVAATKSSERENLSLAENKLAMETLIKRVILPMIEKELNR